MPQFPDFATEEELAAWVETHDTAPYLDDLEDADESFKAIRIQFMTRPLDVRLRSDYLAAIEALPMRNN
jgi:hypothetical protein